MNLNIILNSINNNITFNTSFYNYHQINNSSVYYSPITDYEVELFQNRPQFIDRRHRIRLDEEPKFRLTKATIKFFIKNQDFLDDFGAYKKHRSVYVKCKDFINYKDCDKVPFRMYIANPIMNNAPCNIICGKCKQCLVSRTFQQEPTDSQTKTIFNILSKKPKCVSTTIINDIYKYIEGHYNKVLTHSNFVKTIASSKYDYY